MQNYFKVIKDCHPQLRHYVDEREHNLLMAGGLFLAYAHICKKEEINQYRDLVSIARLVGFESHRLEELSLHRYEYLTDELLNRLARVIQEDDATTDPGRFVAEVLQEMCQNSSRNEAWNGASFSLLEAMTDWTKDASRVVVVDSMPTPLTGLVVDRGNPVSLYVYSREMASLAKVAAKYIGLDIESHVMSYGELNKFSSTPERGTGLVEIFPFGDASFYSPIEKYLDDVSGSMAVVLPPAMGYATNLISIRKAMLDSGRLYAIVSFPSGVLSYANIPVELYLLSPKENHHENVRMVSLIDERFWENRPSRRGARSFSEAGIAMIENVLANGKLREGESLVPVIDLLNSKDACLSVDRYVISPEVATSAALMKRFQRKLKDVAEIIRPVPVRHAEESGDEYREVGSPDINVIGVIESAGRQVFVDRQKISKGFENMVLREDDIVFYIKGNVGTCGLVKNAGTNWICGQSAVIIRLRSDVNGVPPEVLMRYLRSETMSNYLSTLVSGTTIRFLAVKSVENLPIPSLADTDIKIQEQQFQEQLSLMSEIEMLKKRIQTLSLGTLSEKWADA